MVRPPAAPAVGRRETLSTSSRAGFQNPISEEAKSRFEDALAQYLWHTPRRRSLAQIGRLLTTEGGYSLRVFTSVAREHSLSVLNQTGGRPQVWFSSRAKFRKYLPRHLGVIERLSALVHLMGGDMASIEGARKTWVPVETALEHAEELAAIILDLAA